MLDHLLVAGGRIIRVTGLCPAGCLLVACTITLDSEKREPHFGQDHAQMKM
jgi:hypothetical protein